MDISYMTEPVQDYAKAIDSCQSVQELQQCLASWRLVTDDAWRTAQTMTESQWGYFKKGLRAERRGRFAGTKWAQRYSDILLPALMFRVGMVAQQFMVPWGVAYIRCVEAGKIVERGGIATWCKEIGPRSAHE